MRNIGLIRCLKYSKSNKDRNLFKELVLKLKRIFTENLPDDTVKRVQVADNLSVFFINIPYTANELNKSSSLTIRRVDKIISRICSENGIEKCFFSKNVPEHLHINNCIRNPFSGDFIYIALLVQILEYICNDLRHDIHDLDITIIHGNSHTMLNSVIEFLSPIVKFITIITNEKELVQTKAEEIFDNTGLSVRVSSDLRSGLKDSDIILNLGELDGTYVKKLINKKTVIINYGTICNRAAFENLIINRIEIDLPKRINDNIKADIMENFENREIAEIIISHKLEIEANVIQNNTDYSTMIKISRQFVEDNYKITACI